MKIYHKNFAPKTKIWHRNGLITIFLFSTKYFCCINGHWLNIFKERNLDIIFMVPKMLLSILFLNICDKL